MPRLDNRVEDLDVSARQWLLSAHRERSAGNGGDLSFRSWTPVSARTKKKRRFTVLADAGTPLLVAKSAIDDDDEKVAGEWDKLSAMALPPAIRHPRAVARTDRGFVMTYMPTDDLPNALLPCSDAAALATVLERAVDLLATMHLHAAPRSPDAEQRCTVAAQYVPQPCQASPQLQIALERALLGPTHGDLAPWNVRYDGARELISIIDWEDYRPIGIAALDVLNLLVTLGLVIFPDYQVRGMNWLYEQLLEGDHWYALLLRALIARYARRTGQSPRMVIDLLPFHCRWMMNRLRAEGRDPDPLYYGPFSARYAERAPRWVAELPDA